MNKGGGMSPLCPPSYKYASVHKLEIPLYVWIPKSKLSASIPLITNGQESFIFMSELRINE